MPTGFRRRLWLALRLTAAGLVVGLAGISGVGLSATVAGAAGVPVVSGVSPGSGPATGGTTVTVTGANLTGATEVLFGTVPGTNVTVVSDTEVTVVSPAQTDGLYNVFVMTPAGKSAASTGDQFYFAPPVPVVTGVSPRSGSSNGGTLVAVTGTNLHVVGTSQVLFGTLVATPISISNTTIVVVSPRQAAGLYNVFVKTPGGKSAASTADWFTYVAEPPAPIVSGISPKSGLGAGGTVVTVTGTYLTGATQVLFGTVPGTNVTVISDTELTVTSPAETSGTYSVYVVTPNGKSATNTNADFYIDPPPPTVTGVSPRSGSSNGGIVVTITGTNMAGGTFPFQVLFGTVPARVFYDSSTEFMVLSPRQPAGLYNVFVKTPGGKSAASEADWYTVVAEPPAPVVTDVYPSYGPATGGTVVTVTGTLLTGATEVLFGTAPGTDLTVVSDTELTVTTPPGTEGLATVYVVTPDGESTSNPTSSFDYG